MGKLRSLNTCFWSDPWIETLSPEEKLLFIYLITNEKTNMLGVYESSIKKISFETGIDKETVLKALKGFEMIGKVKYINNYVVLTNFIKHQNFNTNMKKSAIDVYNNLPNELKISGLTITKNNPLKSFETLLNHFGMVRKVEDEVEDEIEKEVEIEIEKEDEVEIETNINETNIDSFFDIEYLKKHYLKQDVILQAVINEPKNKIKNIDVLKEYLNKYCEDLKQQGRYMEKWVEFTRYFINCCRSGKFTSNKENNNSSILF